MSGVTPPRGGAGSDRAGAEPILRATPENIRNQKSAFHIVPIAPGKAEEDGLKIVANPRQGNWFTRLFRRLSLSERYKNYQSWERAISILYPDRKGPVQGALKFYHSNITQKHGKIDLTPASIRDMDKIVDGIGKHDKRATKFVEKLIKEQCAFNCGRALNHFCKEESLDIPAAAKKRMVERAMRQVIAEAGGEIISRRITIAVKTLLAAELKDRFFPDEKKDILLR